MTNATWMVLAVLAAIALLSGGVVCAMRLIGRRFGLSQLLQDGIVLNRDGVQMGFTRRSVVPYAEVESVKRLPYLDGIVSILLLKYGISVRWCFTRHFHDIVIVKFKPPRRLRYLVCTPLDSYGFVKELSSHLHQPELRPSHGAAGNQ